MADYAIHDTTLYDIADVIRKKEGSSALIDPADYAERINLMGMLEEKTVSGSVVAFADGADAVKLKSCAVTIAPTLDGVSSVDVVKTGKNLIDISGTDPDNGYVNERWISSINSYNNNNDWHITEYLPILPNTDYTLSGIAYGNNPSVCFYDENKDFISGIAYANRSSFTFTSPPTAKFVRFSIRYDFTVFMMEYGTTATAYEPYVTPTTQTANLGKTIYGGSVDVVNGTGTDNCKKIALGDYTWIKSGTEGNFYCQQITDLWYPSEGGISRYGIGVSDKFEFVQGTPTDGQINAYFNTAYSGYRIFIKKADYAESTSAEFKEYLQSINAHLVYKVNDATAEDFTFTPVPILSRLGDNTMWSDGDLSVVYRSSGTQTLIPPTLISKTISQNGTYSAEDDNADGYDEVTVNVSSLPSGDVDDPMDAENATFCNVKSIFSAFHIADGELYPKCFWTMNSTSGYEGVCFDLSYFELEQGKNYTLSFDFVTGTGATWSGDYQWGCKYSDTQISSGTNSFNLTPDVNFIKQVGTQSVTLNFTANSDNYLVFLLACIAYGSAPNIEAKKIKIQENTSSLLMGGLGSSNGEEENTNSEQEEEI